MKGDRKMTDKREMTGQELHQLASEIAQALGFEWLYCPPLLRPGEDLDTRAQIDGPDGCQITVMLYWRDDDRLTIYGNWPQALPSPDGTQYTFRPDPRHDPGEITAALSRGPAAIAADIRRRFLPKYLPLWDEMIARKAATADQFAAIRAGYARLAAVAGTAHNGDGRLVFRNAAIKLSHDDRGLHAAIDLHCIPFDKTLAIVKVLQGRG